MKILNLSALFLGTQIDPKRLESLREVKQRKLEVQNGM